MGRAVLKTLKETTLNSFFDVCSSAGMQAGVHYTYNAQNGQITVGDSTIIMKDLFAYPSDPNFDDLGSLEITGAFIDEANQITDKAKAIVSSRIRYRLGEYGIKPKLLMTCNPARNWVYNEFYMPWKKGTLEGHRAFVPALVTDNPHISPHYIESLSRLQGADRARLLEGDWDYSDDAWQLMTAEAVYNLWVNEPQRGQPCITWDVAGPGSDRSVVVRWSGLHVEAVNIMEGSDINEHARYVDNEARQYRVPRPRIVVDATGIGLGPAQLLKGCHEYKGGSRPYKNDDFKNLKAECAFLLADYVNHGRISIGTPGHRDALAKELLILRQYKGEMDGKVAITPKDKVRQELGQSPDIGDAIMMRMAIELKGTPLGNDYLRRKGQRYMREAFTERAKNTFL